MEKSATIALRILARSRILVRVAMSGKLVRLHRSYTTIVDNAIGAIVLVLFQSSMV